MDAWVHIERKEEKCRTQRIGGLKPVRLIVERGRWG